MISIILTFNEEDDVAVALNRLTRQKGDCELIVVNSNADKTLTLAQDSVRVVPAPAASRGAQLNAGAAAAVGEVLLFLEARQQLPDLALLAIDQNFKLLPQSIGGNFHLKFMPSTLLAKVLAYILKRRRYRGSYSDNSGIFVRKEVYEAIGGFRPDLDLTGYDFAHRLEEYGPTLFLPETILAPLPSLSEALTCLVAPIFLKRN